MNRVGRAKHIAKLIVGAMSIDGTLSKEEQAAVAKTLDKMGYQELMAYVKVVIEEDQGDLDLYQECRELIESLEDKTQEVSTIIFRGIAEVIATDRFVSLNEASYLSAIAKGLKLNPQTASNILRQVMAEKHGRLEAAGKDIDEVLHPHLKKLLSFEGADEIVGQLPEDSLENMLTSAKQALQEGSELSFDDLKRAFAVLGLQRTASMDDVQKIWKDTINSLNLPKMAELGETFVTAALHQANDIHNAYKTILAFQSQQEQTQKTTVEVKKLEAELKNKETNSKDALAGALETKLTGVGTKLGNNDKEN